MVKQSLGFWATFATLTITQTVSATVYTGSLSSDNGGIVGTGPWITETTPTTISWTVDNITTVGYWHYSYVLTVPRKDISHMILQLSDNVSPGDILNLTWAGGNVEVKTNKEKQGNPNLPDDIYGIKLEPSGDSTTLSVSFDILRIPVWGDFYAKDGKEMGTDVTAWNAGFTSPDSDPNPHIFPAVDGTLDNHILVPDSAPEPGMVVLLALGAIGLMIRRRTRRL